MAVQTFGRSQIKRKTEQRRGTNIDVLILVLNLRVISIVVDPVICRSSVVGDAVKLDRCHKVTRKRHAELDR